MEMINNIYLTSREIEVLRLVALGYNNNEVAKTMNFSIHTVKSHLENIYKKFGVHNKIQALIKAIQAGLIEV